MGAWSFVRGHLQPMLKAQHKLGYAGRVRSASPAPGSPKQHTREQNDVIEQAFSAPSVARRHRKRLIKRRKQQHQ